MRKIIAIASLASLLSATTTFAATPASQYQAAQKSVKYQILQPGSTGICDVEGIRDKEASRDRN